MSLSRRRFLGQASCAAISSLPILNTLLNLNLAGKVAAANATNSDYRALVCIFLSGGIDTYNILVPNGNDGGYTEYQNVRTGVALPQDSLLPITPMTAQSRQLGMHPGLVGVQSMFAARKAAWVTNVGTLNQRITKDQYNDGSVPLPLGLYSHSDQSEQWQTSTPDVRSPRGWGGRVADILQAGNSNETVSMNISLTGQNIFQSGESAFAYTVDSGGAVSLEDYDPTVKDDPYITTPIRTSAVDSQLALQYQHLLTGAFQSQKQKAMDAYALFNAATNITLPASVTFPDSSLADNLQMVAKAIAGHSVMGQRRQTFFVEFGGWDHHDALVKNQAEMVPVLDGAVKAFFDCLAALGLDSNVTLFTGSDFSRTLTTDSEGTDHAWGGNHLVLGGAVNGQNIYGTFPDLYVDNPLDVGRGRIIPQIPVDLYFAELALWLGVPSSELDMVLPNIGRFYDPASSSPPLGLMST